MPVYNVWFKSGKGRQVEANTERAARSKALERLTEDGYHNDPIKFVEPARREEPTWQEMAEWGWR